MVSDKRRALALYLEDDPASAEVVRATLEHAAYTCRVAAKPQDALRGLLQEHVHVFLLDLELPGVDGVELLKMARALGVTSPVVVVSAHPTGENAKALATLGVRRFVVKPVDRMKLLAEVEASVAGGSPQYPLLGRSDQIFLPSRPGKELETLRSRLEAGQDELRRSHDLIAALQGKLQATQDDLDAAKREAEEAKESLLGSARALLGLLEKREAFTGSHGARVAHYSSQIAGRIGLPEPSRHILEVAALLHDIGKITLPETVAVKRAEDMDSEQLLAYRRHSEAGQAIIEHMTSGDRVAAVVRAHHENFDGLGFPDGLRGSEIPIEARILRTADLIDRSLHIEGERSPRFRAARNRVSEQRAKALDPSIADHARELLDEMDEFLRSHEVVPVEISNLGGGEILARDITTQDGFLYLPEGEELTPRHLQRLRNIAERQNDLLTVLIYAPREPDEES